MDEARIDERLEVSPTRTSRRRARSLRRGPLYRLLTSAEFTLYVSAGVLSSLVAAVALRIWRADLGIPLFYSGDAVAVLAHFKTNQETGWYEHQSRLGAPVGQVFHDFPTADNFHQIVASLLGGAVNHVGTAVNLYYLVGFPLAALTAVWFFRVCGVTRPMSLSLGILYSIAPFHFFRNEAHLWLASYYSVPLALVVVVWVARGEALWLPRLATRGPRRWLTGRGLLTTLILILLGTSSTYFSVFTLVLLATAAVGALLRFGDWRRFFGAVSAGLLITLTMVANMAPDLLYQRDNGLNTEALSRNPTAIEHFGLKLTSMILPTIGHQVPAWSQFRATYDATYPLPSEQQSLGMMASVGFLGLLYISVVGVAGVWRKQETPASSGRRGTLIVLASLNLIAFLCGTMGGFATVMSFATGNLRAWNRISIVIAALSLAALGLLLDAGREEFSRTINARRRLTQVISFVVAASIFMVGVWDQLVIYTVPDYAGNKLEYAADADWYSKIEVLLPADSMIFQLPHIAYPESPSVNGVTDTDAMKPFLHTATLRWSAGGIKGRADSDWPRVVAAEEPLRMVDGLAAAGFAGIMLDRKALGSSDLEGNLQAILGQPHLVRSDGRFAYFDLRQETLRLEASNDRVTIAEAARETVEPTLMYPRVDIEYGPAADGSPVWTATSDSSKFVLDNARDEPAVVTVTMTLSGPAGAKDARLTYGSRTWDVSLEGGDTQTTITVTAPAGRTDLGVTAGPVSAGLSAKQRQIGVAAFEVVRVHQVELGR